MRSAIGTVGFLLLIGLIYQAAEAQLVTITGQDCASLVRHVASDDTAYKPGVDVDGKPVVPADLGSAQAVELPKEFSIPVTVDLQRRLGVPPDPNQYQTQNFTVGTVTWKDGAAWFNGRPLQDEESRRLSEACQKRLAPSP